MSELTPTPEELIEDIEYEVEEAQVIPSPVDPTLTHVGEAADAKAVGDALRNISQNIKVNNKTAGSDGNIPVYADDITLSDEPGSQTVSDAINGMQARTAGDILFSSEGTETIVDVVESINDSIDEIANTIDSEISFADIDEIIESVFGGGE